ncbi:hypothetical protein [Sphingobacterium sp. 1.A.4]|uniref:hypothetical protein n=1 Tax=Sphingobacterium sp. 1.A.4 TaxID=2044603 RepID=UPI000C0C0463|nr:hypothetical protein [Sphingobacterium sp. 1.A.4]
MTEKEIKQLQYENAHRIAKKQSKVIEIDIKPKNWFQRIKMRLGLSKKLYKLEMPYPTLSTRSKFTSYISGIDIEDSKVLYKSETYERLIMGISILFDDRKEYSLEKIQKIISELDEEEFVFMVTYIHEVINDDFFLTCTELIKTKELPKMNSAFSLS